MLNTEDYVVAWKKMISEYWDAVAIGSDYGLYVFFTHKKKPPLCVKLPEVRLGIVHLRREELTQRVFSIFSLLGQPNAS